MPFISSVVLDISLSELQLLNDNAIFFNIDIPVITNEFPKRALSSLLSVVVVLVLVIVVYHYVSGNSKENYNDHNNNDINQ